MIKSFRDKQFLQPLLIWLVFLIWYIFFAAGPFTGVRLKTLDFFSSLKYYFSPSPSSSNQIVIVAIDKVSRQELNLKWPWGRGVIAQLLMRISANSPKVIGIDLIFSGASEDPSEDRKLADAIGSSVPTVISYRWVRGEKELPLDIFRENAWGVGFVNKPKDVDEVMRNARVFIRTKDGIELSLETEIVCALYGITHKDIILKDNILCLRKEICIPVSKGGITPINYTMFPAEFTIVPAYLVLKNKIPSSYFKNKIVLIGYTDPLMHDEHLTPMGMLPGIVIVGNTLLMILDRNFLYNAPLFPLLALVVIGGASIIGASRRKSFSVFSFLTFSFFVLLVFIFTFLRIKNIQLDYFSVFFVLFMAYVVSVVYRYAYLIYYNNKLKNIAVHSPLTGFYTRRYFSLKWEQDFQHHFVSSCLVLVEMKNYHALIRDFEFDEIKELIKMWADYLRTRMENSIGRVMFGQFGVYRFAVAVYGRRKEVIVRKVQDVLVQCKKVNFKLGEKAVSIEMKGVIACGDSEKKKDASTVLFQAEKVLDKDIEEGEDIVLIDSFEEMVVKNKDEVFNEEEFLISDFEARNRELEKMLKNLIASQKETEEAYFSVILSLIKALEEKDIYTQGHSERVARYARAIAEEVGLPAKEVDNIYKAALLHDIGKIGLPDYLLHKKGELTDEEISKIRKHEIISVEILKPIKAFEEFLPIILHHHEFFNGEGYPYGLSGDMIPRGAQILAVADSFDAMTSGRGYRKVKTKEEAIQEMEAHKGEQFNPVYVDALKRVLGL